jgi:thioredoxin-related protein
MFATCRRLNVHRASSPLLVVALLAGIAPAADKVEWRSDYDSARKEAAEKSRPIFLDFGTEDCVHCKRMHQTTFKDPAIIKLLNENFIPLKVDANREPHLAQSLRVQAYPTMILAGHDGKIVGWIEGYLETSRMSEQLQRVSALQTPDWMARDYQEAAKSMAAGEYSRAVSLLKNIVEDGKARPVQTKAQDTLQVIEKQATSRLDRAKQMNEKGQTLEALDLLAELLKQYAGTRAADDGGKLLASLADSPDVRSHRRVRLAQEMLQRVKEDLKAGRYLTALDQSEHLSATYRDLPEGKEGSQLALEIKADPQRMAQVCESMNERLAKMYMDLADTWEKKGNREQAIVCWEKVRKIQPVGAAAANAEARLEKVNGRTPGVTTSFEKP